MKNLKIWRTATIASALSAVATSAVAEVVEATADGYKLRHEATAAAPPAEVWARLVAPSTWWDGEHTYSGAAANLSLTPRAGGDWREDWATGSVVHGSVLYVEEEKALRLDAPFGPLQGIGAQVTWTITLEPSDAGTKIVFDEVAVAPPFSNLDAIAPAVDQVKSIAISRLASMK